MISLSNSADRVIRRWPSSRSREWLAHFLGRAERDANVVAVIAVGSAVRSNVASEDLDLIVLCRDRKLLLEKAPIEIDLRAFELDMTENGIRDGQDLLTWAVLFGASLLDSEGEWSRIVARWKDRVPLPDPGVARERASVALKQLEKMRALGDTEAVVDLRVSHLTHLARAALAQARVYARSRPELPSQLRQIDETGLADRLERALSARAASRGVRAAV